MDPLDDSDIDLAIDEHDEGERCALELADRIRMVAAQDPAIGKTYALRRL